MDFSFFGAHRATIFKNPPNLPLSKGGYKLLQNISLTNNAGKNPLFFCARWAPYIYPFPIEDYTLFSELFGGGEDGIKCVEFVLNIYMTNNALPVNYKTAGHIHRGI